MASQEFSKVKYNGSEYAVKDATARSFNDNLEIGGRNILRGSGELKSGNGTWESGTWRSTGSGCDISYNLAYNYPTAPCGKAVKMQCATAGVQGGICQDKASVQKGKITFSVWAKSSIAGGLIKLQPVWAASGTEGLTENKNYGNKSFTIADTAWHKYTCTVEVDRYFTSDASIGYIYYTGENVGDILYVTAPKLEYGTKATDWTPAPEDISAAKAAEAAKADTATKADSATKADTATKADSATKADTATKADSAEKATSADSATVASSLKTVDLVNAGANNYPFFRFASISALSGTTTDVDDVFLVRQHYQGGRFGIVKVSLRTNASGKDLQASAQWLVRKGFDEDAVTIAWQGVTGESCYADVFLKVSSTYARIDITRLSSGVSNAAQSKPKNWELASAREVADTTTTDRLTSYNVAASLDDAATTFHSGTAYTNSVTSLDMGSVKYAATAGTAATATKADSATKADTAAKASTASKADAATTATTADKAKALTSDAKTSVLNMVYPVGSIYMSVNSTSPQSFLGGTWERLKDRFLLGAGDTYSAGTTGGEASHKLTVSEMPAHTHALQADENTATTIKWTTSAQTNVSTVLITSDGKDVLASDKAASAQQALFASGTTGSAGGESAHNNMPPYLAVYVWKRTA